MLLRCRCLRAAAGAVRSREQRESLVRLKPSVREYARASSHGVTPHAGSSGGVAPTCETPFGKPPNGLSSSHESPKWSLAPNDGLCRHLLSMLHPAATTGLEFRAGHNSSPMSFLPSHYRAVLLTAPTTPAPLALHGRPEACLLRATSLTHSVSETYHAMRPATLIVGRVGRWFPTGIGDCRLRTSCMLSVPRLGSFADHSWGEAGPCISHSKRYTPKYRY